ncbi:MAG: FadR/GntR family transcriptional regulator [Actinocatenispora sp.]
MSVTDEAILKIKDLILSGHLRPGDRVPREAELAGQLGISRNTLREAVRALTVLGVLDVRQGDGTYVSSLEPRQLLGVMGFVVDLLHDRTVLELMQVRRMLEPPATALAASRITDEQLAELGELMSQMRKAGTSEELVTVDAQFHDAIIQATGNTVLVSVLRGLSGSTVRARIWHGIAREGATEQTHAGHEAIYQALASHDPPLAHAAALNHVAFSESWLREAVGVDSPEPDGSTPVVPVGAGQ